MLYKKLALGLSGLARLAAALPSVDLVERQAAACPSGYQQLYVATQVATYPLVINQFFENNTVINTGGITFNINNAPVNFSTTVTATSTQTVTTTLTIGATSVPTTFVLQVALGVGKRQTGSGQYIGAGGSTVSDCTSGTQFELQDGKLSSGGLGVSAPDAINSIVFAVSSTEGPISVTFSEVDGTIEWSNPAFFGGKAVFCFTNGVLTANFQESTQTCAPASLSLVPATCAGASSGTTTSSPPVAPSSSTTSPPPPASPTGGPSGTTPSPSAGTSAGTSASVVVSPSASASAVACPIAGETRTAGVCSCQPPLAAGTDPTTGATNCAPVTNCAAVTGSKLDPTTNQCACNVNGEVVTNGACACPNPLVTGTDPTTGATNCAPVTSCTANGATLNTATNQCQCSAPGATYDVATTQCKCTGTGAAYDAPSNTCKCTVSGQTLNTGGGCSCVSPNVPGTDPTTGATNCALVTKCTAPATLNTTTNQCQCTGTGAAYDVPSGTCKCTVTGQTISSSGNCSCNSPFVPGTDPTTGATTCGTVTSCTTTGATLNTTTNQCQCTGTGAYYDNTSKTCKCTVTTQTLGNTGNCA